MGSVGAAKSSGGRDTEDMRTRMRAALEDIMGAGDASEESIEEAERYIDQVEYDRDRKYKEWDDRASGGWTYAGDGRDQEQWFKENSNYDEIINNMTPEERDAFLHYWTPGHFMDGQQYRDFDKMSEQDQRLTRIYDRILDKAVLHKDMVVVRRATAELVLGKGHTRVSSLADLRSLRGQIVTSKGSMSTGAAREGLTIGGSKNVEYVIHYAAGTKGAGMWIGDKRINGWGAEQREFMTNRDSAFAIGRSSYDKKRDVYRVNLYYVGRTAHDYGKRGK